MLQGDLGRASLVCLGLVLESQRTGVSLLQRGFICIWLSERPGGRDWTLRVWHVLALLGNLCDCLSPWSSVPQKRPH